MGGSSPQGGEQGVGKGLCRDGLCQQFVPTGCSYITSAHGRGPAAAACPARPWQPMQQLPSVQ